jgi:hypothetical protein
MSHPAIGIGHPVSAPPRRPLMCPSCAPTAPRSHGAVFGILHTPYGIRNSEFQNRESGVQGFFHAMKDYPLTRWIMVR